MEQNSVDKEVKQYNIDSFEKLCNVATMENATRLAIDLGQWIVMYAAFIAEMREKYPKETKNKKNTKIANSSFVWIDDGKNDMNYVNVENKDNGEIIKIDLTNLNSEPEP